MKTFAYTLFMSLAPVAASAAPLGEELRDYVVAFDMQALDGPAKAKLRMIVDDPDATHGDKVLRVHTVLTENDALRHVDIHGEALNAASETQMGLASFD